MRVCIQDYKKIKYENSVCKINLPLATGNFTEKAPDGEGKKRIVRYMAVRG
jgi:hypothetical protein